MDLIATDYLTGGLLTLLMPVGLLIAVLIYWAVRAAPPARWRRASVRKLILVAAVVAGIAGGALVHSLGSTAAPSFVLPELHGQMSWARGARPAPPLAALRRLRGRTAVLALVRPGCPAAPSCGSSSRA